MPQSTAMLTQMGYGYAPVASGVPHERRFPTEGLPIPGGPFGQMAAMAAMPAMYRSFGSVGSVPMGVGHDQNVYDRMMSDRFTQSQMSAIRQAAELDRRNMMDTMRGVAAATGTPWGVEQRRAASSIAGQAVQMSPLFAQMMPEFMDQMGGLRGSAAVLTNRMMDAGRYRIDPVTGRMGITADTSAATARSVYADLYGAAGMRQMHGMTAGQAGGLFNELQLRGMVSTGAAERGYGGYRGDDPRSGTYRAVTSMGFMAPNDLARAAKAAGVNLGKGADGLSGADLDKLALDPGVSDKLRSFDGDRIKRTLKGYSTAVAAMRDIFGDMGKPNAPMQEIMAGLEALTQGASAQLDPNRIAGMARQTYNLAKQTGVTLDNTLLLQQHAAQRGQQLGLEPMFAAQAAQGGLAFGGAYRGQGHAAHTAWGAMNADQVTQMDINLRQQAASSNMANRMAVAVRLGDAAGGFASGSDQSRLVAAIRSGSTQWQDGSGRMRDVNMGDRDFVGLMAGAKGANGKSLGISEGDVFAMLGQRETNREAIFKHGMAGTVRRAQGAELTAFVGDRFTETLSARFADELVRQGVPQGEAGRRAREMASSVGRRSASRLGDLSTAEIADQSEREGGFARIVGEELKRAGFGGVVDDRFLRQTAGRAFGDVDRALQFSPYAAFGNYQNVHRLNNRGTMDAAERSEMQARHDAQVQEAMTGLGRGSVLSRAVSALQKARPGDDQAALKVIASALGGVATDDINAALLPQMRGTVAKREAVEKLQAELQRERDPEKRAALEQRLNGALRELTAEAGSLAQLGEQHGMFSGASLTAKDLDRAARSSGELITAQKDIAGLTGNFGHQVSPAQIARARAEMGGGTDAQAMAYVRAQRRQVPLQATAADVAALKQQYPNSSDGELRELANARLRARRLGVEEADYKVRMRGTGAGAELAALDEAFAGMREMSLTVTEQDRAAFAAANPGLAGPSDEQVGLYVAANPHLKGKSREEVLGAMRDDLIMKRRQAGHRGRFGAFWGSEEGAAFREKADFAGQDVENIASALISNPAMAKRFGAGGVDLSDKLKSGRQRLQELANYHSGGDVARLMAGDLNIDASTPQGREALARVQAEVKSIQGHEAGALIKLRESVGKSGRHFVLSDEDEAKRLLGKDFTDEQLKKMTYDVSVARQVTPDEEKLLAGGKAGDIEKIAKRLGLRTVDLEGVPDVFGRIEKLQKAAYDADNASTQGIVTDILGEYGLAAGGEPSAVQRQMAQAMEGTRGRAMGKRMLGTARTLKEVAGRKGAGDLGGIDDMAEAYFRALRTGDPNNMRSLQAEYAFDMSHGELTAKGQEDWKAFEEAMQFQQQTGLLKFGGKGGHRKLDQEDDLLKIYNQAMEGGTLQRSATEGPGSATMPTRMEMSGTVTIRGDQLDLSGAWGGGRNYVPPGGS